MNDNVACVAGRILVPVVLSWGRSRHVKRRREGIPLLDLLPIFTRLRRLKTTALAAKSPATQAKESVSLRSLLPADPFPFFSPYVTTLWIRCPMYGNPSFISVRREKRARHVNNHARDWRRETGEARFSPRFLRIACACTPLTKSPAVYRDLSCLLRSNTDKCVVMRLSKKTNTVVAS